MAAAADVEDDVEPKGSKLPLLLGVVLAIAGGGGGFFAVSSGILGGSAAEDAAMEPAADEKADVAESAKPTVAFVPLEPLIISLPHTQGQMMLRFRAELEVATEYADEVAAIKPRIVDVLNGYLRAVELSELQDPTILARLRAQMLRRVQVVAGPDRVRDLLVMEFVLN